MRSCSAACATAIAAQEVRLCELYICELAKGDIYRYTDHDVDLTWDLAGNVYTAIPIKRSPIRFNSDGQYNECELTLGIQNLAVLNTIKHNILEAAKITHKRIRWDASYASDEEFTLEIWTPDVNFNRSILQLRLISYLDSLNVHIPARNHQEPCNNSLFDPTCGLSRAAHKYSGTATAGTQTTLTDAGAGTVYTVEFDAGDRGNPISVGDTITGSVSAYTAVVCHIVYLTPTTGHIWYVELSNALNFADDEVLSSGGNSVTCNGTPAEDTTVYEQGEIEITSGNNDGERRPILSSSGSVRTVMWPLPEAIQTGDTYDIYPGCDLTAQTCALRFDNAHKWDGYTWIPPVEQVMF
jgi:hypothetical protein